MPHYAVVFGGPSPEHDISILTGLQAARSLSDAGHEISCVFWSKAGTWLRVPVESEAEDFLGPDIKGAVELELVVPGGFVERKRKRATPLELDAILNSCHGGPGEDGTLAGVLALAGQRVSGPSPQAAGLAMDKLATWALADSIGVATIPTALVTEEGAQPALPSTPWVVKPRFGGSSLGVEAGIEDIDTARALARHGVGRAGMLAQPELSGWVDLNVAVRTHPQLEISEIERPLHNASGIYGYQDKYLVGAAGMDSAPRELPAVVPDSVRKQIRESAAALVTAFDLSGAPRIDFLWDGEEKVVLCEINSIPGAWGAYLWQATDVPRAKLYEDLLLEAKATPNRPQWAATSDGRALRVASSIAAKLT